MAGMEPPVWFYVGGDRFLESCFIFPTHVLSCQVLNIRSASKIELAHGKDSSQGYQNIREQWVISPSLSAYEKLQSD